MINPVKLSIIIPHYNNPSLLQTLLTTIMNDSNGDLEVIIVDDYSDKIYEEKLIEVINGFDSENIFLYSNTQSKSAGSCRNIGLNKSRGQWILFADSDDYFLPNMYKTVSEYFAKNVDIVYFPPTSIYLDTGEMAIRHKKNETLVMNYLDSADRKNELFLRTKFVEPWSKLYRRKFIIENNLQFDMTPISNDVYFSVTSGLLAKDFLVSDKQIYCVTKYSGSITTIISKERYQIRADVYIKQVSFIRNQLPKSEFKMLGLDGKTWIVGSILNKFGMLYTIRLLMKFKKNKIKLFHRNNLRLDKLINYLRFRKVEKKYSIIKDK
jgi:glycosyltransferase involved in cell wall biosynthesis